MIATTLKNFACPDLPAGFQQARTPAELAAVQRFRQRSYRQHFPQIQDSRNDPYDAHAVVLFTRNAQGGVASTGRLVFDSPLGLPEDHYLQRFTDPLRAQGANLAEAGRFVIDDPLGRVALLGQCYRACYVLAKAASVTHVLLAHKYKDLPFHQRLLATTTLPLQVHNLYGGPHHFAFSLWHLADTPTRFFRWTGLQEVA